MGNNEFEGDDEEEEEATAVVNLAELRSGSAKPKRDFHLLVHVQGTELGRVRELVGNEVYIGRANDADLWLSDDGVSRRHAKFSRTGQRYTVEDLDSANGTFVQGQRITTKLLEDGDQIQLGPSAIFRYSITDDDQRALLEQLYSTSVTDALTGARNREYLDSLLVTELSYARRHQHDLSFILFDLDHFKALNDTYGHPAGDSALSQVADAVREQLRAEDSLCRYGGEEFCIVLRSIDLAGAHATGERIRQKISETKIVHENLELKVTASVGCSSRSELDDPTATGLIDLADKRLYRAKNSGRNRVVSSDN